MANGFEGTLPTLACQNGVAPTQWVPPPPATSPWPSSVKREETETLLSN
jgi:hypothetical protein